MNVTKKNSKKIKIKSNDKYEEKPIMDYLISSLEETKEQINKNHENISNKNNNIKNEKISKEEEDKINEKFNKVFKINNKENENLFEYINNINKNHVKKYKTILKFLNLNLVFDNSEENIQEKKDQMNNNKSNKLKESSIKSEEVIKDEQIKDKNKEKQNNNVQVKENLSNIKFKSDFKEREKKYNIFKFDLYESIDKEEKKDEEIDKNDAHLIIDYKDNVNYFDNNKNNKTSTKLKKFFNEIDNNEQDIDNEDNEIIINENDDLITPRDVGDSNKINSKDKINNIYEKDSIISLEQTPINNKNRPNYYSYDKKVIPNKHIFDLKKKEVNIENQVNKEDDSEKDINNDTMKDRINIKTVEKRLFKKNHTNNNIKLTFVDTSAKKDICTCDIF